MQEQQMLFDPYTTEPSLHSHLLLTVILHTLPLLLPISAESNAAQYLAYNRDVEFLTY